jgi:methylmalonyl-CoA mutase N-terminal domain/subunit
VLLHESGVANVPDPFGGSEYVEGLTDAIEQEARRLIAEIDERGGAVAAIESGWVKGRIEDEAFAQQRAIEQGTTVIVGVNRYPDPADSDIELLAVTQASEQAQIERLQAVREGRDSDACERALAAVAAAAGDASVPLLEPLRSALAARCTVGEVCGALKQEWGSYDAQVSDGR